MKCIFLVFFQLIAMFSLAFAIEADQGNPQGLLWRTQESGHSQAAQLLEGNLKNILEFAPLDSLTRQGGGVSVSYIAKFEGNIFAIVKESDPALAESYRHERAAYLLDKLLGLHMVPLTTIREHLGKTYSLQLYYPSLPSDGFIDLMESEFFLRRADVTVFDYLINNVDRNLWEGSNVILGKEGRMILFDHARSFFDGTSEVELGDLREVGPQLRVRILATTELEVRDQLKNLIAKDALNDLIQRLEKLQSELRLLPPLEAPEVEKRGVSKYLETFEIPEKLESLHFENIFELGSAGMCSNFFKLD